YDAERGRWYLTASWQRPVVKAIPLEAARSGGMIGVDANAGHFAAYRLDRHGKPAGDPHRFSCDLSGAAGHRDAQVRHAITRLLHWARRCGVAAIGIEDLDFAHEKTREKHGRNKRFRQLISGMPTGKLKARLVSMAAGSGLSIVAVDPAYTSMWGDQHWRKPLAAPRRAMTRHDAASVAIGRRVPSGTRSGDGRHRPATTRAIAAGIGPPRPDQAHGDAREPARPPRNAHTMHAAGRERNTERGGPALPEPSGTRAVTGHGPKTRTCSLTRNGVKAAWQWGKADQLACGRCGSGQPSQRAQQLKTAMDRPVTANYSKLDADVTAALQEILAGKESVEIELPLTGGWSVLRLNRG
ncbi:MAG: hypothetical protein JWM19_1368, partial [Actinomycetia bacterium]|nr:hypothetical protein [Actinomycetes bacterium]